MRVLVLAAAASTLACPSSALTGGPTVLLRDSIGPDNTTTNGNTLVNATWTGATWFHTPARLQPAAAVRLTRFRGIIAQMTDQLVFAEFDYLIRVWDSQTALATNAAEGNIANILVDAPSEPPLVYGLAVSPGQGIKTSWEMIFDLSLHEIVIPAGAAYFLSIQGYPTTGTGIAGSVGWVASTESGESDWFYRHNGPPLPVASIPVGGLHSGRLGFEVTAELVNPPCPGDANGDGVVNFTDLNIVLSEFGTSGPPGSLQGDLDGDGDVDFGDLNIVLSAFGTTC